MSSSGKSSSGKHKSKSEGRGESRGDSDRPLEEAHPILYEAACAFITEHCNFESSVVLERVLKELGKTCTLQDAFAVPLTHHLLDLSSALTWALFLHCGPERAQKDGEEPPAHAFSARSALSLIAQVYDNGLQSQVLDHFEPDSDDESDEESSEGEGDAAAE